MNVLSGALLGLKLGFALCQLHNTVGALLLYAQSRWLGKRLVQRYFSKQARQLRSKIKEWKGEVVIRFIFLRMMPVTPNWAVNAISAHLDVSIAQFAAGVFFGLIPYNFLSVKAGVSWKTVNKQAYSVHVCAHKQNSNVCDVKAREEKGVLGMRAKKQKRNARAHLCVVLPSDEELTLEVWVY